MKKRRTAKEIAAMFRRAEVDLGKEEGSRGGRQTRATCYSRQMVLQAPRSGERVRNVVGAVVWAMYILWAELGEVAGQRISVELIRNKESSHATFPSHSAV